MGYPPHKIQSQKRSPHRSPASGILRVRRRGELLVLKNMQSWLADLASNRSDLTGARFFRNWKLDQSRFVYDMKRIVNYCKTIYIYIFDSHNFEITHRGFGREHRNSRRNRNGKSRKSLMWLYGTPFHPMSLNGLCLKIGYTPWPWPL